jgi:predicted DNA-binding protein
MTDDLKTLSAKLPKDQANHIQELADHHNVPVSAVLREVIDTGLRAPKYYDEFEIQPESQVYRDSE